jgi:cell division protein FtsQ
MPVEQGRSRRRSSPPAIVPRVAAIGGAFSNRPRQRITLRSVMMSLAGLVLFGGAAVAGAAWTGGSLFDAHEAMARSTDEMAANSGFAVNTDEVIVTGVAGARADEIRAVINPDGRRSLLSMDPADVKARVESLDWVESARVRRLWPGKLDIHVERREALARWRDSGAITVIDFNGERLLAERAEENSELPLVEGEGAAPAASAILAALEDLPHVRARVANLVRIGERRWNLEFLDRIQGVHAVRRTRGLPDRAASRRRGAHPDQERPGLHLPVDVVEQQSSGPARHRRAAHEPRAAPPLRRGADGAVESPARATRASKRYKRFSDCPTR